jgi:hypothetical protein
MPHTTTLLQSYARSDAHRLAQKISLLAMASWMLACHWAQGLTDIATPDEAMVTVILGLLAYVTANHATRLRFAANSHSEDEWLHMFVIVDDQ